MAKKQPKKQVTVRISADSLKNLHIVGEKLLRNSSEMFERAIEHYLRTGAAGDIAEARKAKEQISNAIAQDIFRR